MPERTLLARVICPSPEEDATIVKTTRYLNLLTFIFTIITNTAAGGAFEKTVADISHDNPTWITPADYAFAIWGLIYTSILIFSVYQVLPVTYKPQPETSIHRESFYLISHGVSIFFILSNIFNCIWIIIWLMESVSLALFVILCFAFSLFAIVVRFQPWLILIPKENTDSSERTPLISTNEPCRYKSLWNLTPSTVVASIVNVFAVFFVADIEDPFATIGIAKATVVILAILEISFLVWRRDPVITFVGTWALFAICKSRLAEKFKDADETKSFTSL
ncbi:hypothetical protein HK096_004363, partial [Nowakowskiella sp. JEL0078]